MARLCTDIKTGKTIRESFELTPEAIAHQKMIDEELRINQIHAESTRRKMEALPDMVKIEAIATTETEAIAKGTATEDIIWP